jgi:CheY-like chemotaxis protein
MKAAGGVLGLRQSLVEVRKSSFDVIPELTPGWYVRLDISDTGCGMDQATLERIFEPFFTTRPHGEGTGLGLAVTLGILQSHGGGISVQSEPCRGTIFSLYFPAMVSGASEAQTVATPPGLTSGAGQLSGRGERVVVIDDEPEIAKLASLILERGGYEATAYTNPHEALAAIQAAPLHYDLVLTDLTMPGMTGLELARELRMTRPELPVVLCTGVGHVLDGSALTKAGIKAKLTKPFSSEDLCETIHRLFPL